MRPRVDLNLIRQSLQQLNDSTYFEPRLHDFTDRLIAAIDHVLQPSGTYDAAIEAAFAGLMRLVQSYLSGSTTNEIPYEVVYCLNDALKRWVNRDTVIITQLTEGHNFHLMPVDPWQFIQKTLTGYDSSGFDSLLVMIGVPRLYAHKPLFCVPLYHELGHFVDITHKVSEFSLLVSPARIAAPAFDELSHRREFFADLFAACFTGRSGISALEAVAAGHSASNTHPATLQRASVTEAFLNGNTNNIVSIFQSALLQRSLPPLRPFFEPASVSNDFDDLRTFVPNDIEQVHGMLISAWSYMFDAIDQRRNPWNIARLSEGDIEAITNDLVEKSIRNFAIRTVWNETASS
ncbi:MAG: hypothetical protein ACLP8A_13100 [Methylovirgula sp.]